MDILSFISALRQEGLVLGDYNAVRGICSRRLATLRKRLGRQNSKSKKFIPQPPLTAEEVAKDPKYPTSFPLAPPLPSIRHCLILIEPRYIHLYLYSSERAWAHAMHMKSLLADDTASGSASMRSHLVSRLHKAHSHATALRQLLLDPSSNASENDILEASAYAASLAGSESFERSHWEESIKSFAISRVIYSAFLESTKDDIYKDQLTSTIDPSIRYSAYQLKLPRNMDAATISRKYFPQGAERLVPAVQILDPKAFSDPTSDTPEAGGARVGSLTWRSRTAPVEDADISAALTSTHIAENTYHMLQRENPSSTEAFDGTLLAWQEAVDATKRAIDQLAKDVGMGEQKMQNLQLIWTVVNYSLICWRIGRNRVMIEGIAQGGKKRRDELRVKKLGHLKEEVALYDAILQVNALTYSRLFIDSTP